MKIRRKPLPGSRNCSSGAFLLPTRQYTLLNHKNQEGNGSIFGEKKSLFIVCLKYAGPHSGETDNPAGANPAEKQKTEGKTLGISDEITLTNGKHYAKIELHTVGVWAVLPSFHMLNLTTGDGRCQVGSSTKVTTEPSVSVCKQHIIPAKSPKERL